MIKTVLKLSGNNLPVLNYRLNRVADDGKQEVGKGEEYPCVRDPEYRSLLEAKEKRILE